MAIRNFTVHLALVILFALTTRVQANSYKSTCEKDWFEKSAAEFAQDCADMAFASNLKDRQTIAWMFFTRINQLIEDQHGVAAGNSVGARVPQWMAWATNEDTFIQNPSFQFSLQNRDDLIPITAKKLHAGPIALNEPASSNEEVARNVVGHDYITKQALLNTKTGVLKFVRDGNRVDMPVGAIEIKVSWLKVPPGGAPKGALVFNFNSGAYWFRGMHIMAKMRSRPASENLFYSEEPSWFWTTFEFNSGPGVEHVRDTLITQRKPLSTRQITSILQQGGIAGYGFEAYSPSGTQIRFTVDGKGSQPVILGHTAMEDFTAVPNPAQPHYWTFLSSSCHSCHGSAAVNPNTGRFFPIATPTGALTQQYYAADEDSGTIFHLGDGFIPLDFMWSIVFYAK